MTYRYPLATTTWDNKELEAIQRVIASDRFSMGAEVGAFERQFASYFGTKFAVMVNSGSSANLLMTAALRYCKNPEYQLQPGDEIIVPAVSWPTTYYPLAQYGLRMKFVDIDLNTLNYDLQALEMSITPETKAIMVVNLLGNPNAFDRILTLATQHNLIIIEDNCESMAAKFNGKQAGTFGLMGTFSCFFSHHISTMEGGVVVTNDEELYETMLVLRAHGWTRNLPKANTITGIKSDDPFEESFKFVLPGYNLRPLEMSGAIGQEQLKKLDQIIEGRRDNAIYFQEQMVDHPVFKIQQEVGVSSWFGFSLILQDGIPVSRKEIVEKLDSLGFECRPIVGGNFAKNEVMKYFNYEISGDLANADYIDANGLFIGNHHYPIKEAIDTIADFDV